MMTKERVLRGLTLAVLVWVTSVLPASAQADGRFAGTVLDSSGAFVPGATVTVKNEKTGEQRTATSSAQGIYVVTNLKPSTYTIRAKSGDFAPLEYTGMQLFAGQEFHLDLELKPAGFDLIKQPFGLRDGSRKAIEDYLLVIGQRSQHGIDQLNNLLVVQQAAVQHSLPLLAGDIHAQHLAHRNQVETMLVGQHFALGAFATPGNPHQ